MKFLLKIALWFLEKVWFKNLRYRWSKWRHRKSKMFISVSDDISYGRIPKNLSDIKGLTSEIMKRFKYTPDGLDKLFDSMDTPASCWHRTFFQTPLRDDCDGYHAALYWAISKRFNCALLTVLTDDIVNSHTVLIAKTDGGYCLVNYLDVQMNLPDLDSVVKYLLNKYYQNKVSIMATELSKWDGHNRTWYSIKEENF